MTWILWGLARLGGAFKWLFEFFKKYPLYCIMGIAIVMLLWQFNKVQGQRDDALTAFENEKTAHAQTVTNYRTASAKALKDAEDNKAKVETKYVEIRDEKQIAITNRLRDELASVRRQIQARANTGSSDSPSVSGTTDATSGAARTSAETLMDDAIICTRNTVIAEGWLEWWNSVSSVPTLPPTQ